MELLVEKKLQMWATAREYGRLLILQEGTTSDTDRFVDALKALGSYGTRDSEMGEGPLLIPERELDVGAVHAVIEARGLTWLKRVLELSGLDGSCLYGAAIAADYPLTAELLHELGEIQEGFVLDDEEVVEWAAGCENSVEKLEKWAPHILGQDFPGTGAQGLHNWDTLMGVALNTYDTALMCSLFQRITPSMLADYLFRHWGYFADMGDGEDASKMICLLDEIPEEIERLRAEGDPRLQRLVTAYSKRCIVCDREPSPEVLSRLVRNTKSAIL